MKGCGYIGCTDSAAVAKYGIGLCFEHFITLHNTVRTEAFSKKVSKLYESGNLSQHSAGITYVIQLPNLNIKIGTTRDGKSLYRRLVNLGRQFRGKPILLATLPGGETQEAVLHARFSDFRRYDLFTEQFQPAAEIFYFAKETGLEAEGLWAKQAFDPWEYVPGVPIEPTDNDRRFLAFPCFYCGAEQGDPCIWKAETSETVHSSRKTQLDYLVSA